MKYYLIAGEASGDLHASRLMAALRDEDPEACFRCFGGDMMAGQGGELVQHYRDLAYMGFLPVLMHLPTIMRGMKRCREDILAWQPDVLILVDYPGFNLKIARYVKQHTHIPVFYYISPKIWAWKEYRIKDIKRDVDCLLSILPFEVPFYEKHHYPIHYVGNPTVDEVDAFLKEQGARSKGQGARGKGQGARGKEQGARSKTTVWTNVPSSLCWQAAASRRCTTTSAACFMQQSPIPRTTNWCLPLLRASTMSSTANRFKQQRLNGKMVNVLLFATRRSASCSTARQPSSPAAQPPSKRLCCACRKWCATT